MDALGERMYLMGKPEESAGGEGIDIELETDTSVYQDAVFMPLVLGCDDSGTWVPTCRIYLKVGWLLLLNMVLQTFTAYKMLAVTESSLQDFRDDVMSLCEVTKVKDAPWLASLPSRHTQQYFDCGPLTLSVMSNVDYVDFDKDGKWTFHEAEELENAHGLYHGRVSSFKKTFWGTNYYRDPTLDVNRDIPMAWLRNHSTLIQLCILQDGQSCGNFEKHGALKKAFPDIRGKDVRIRKCRGLFDEDGLCPSMFGSRYNWYAQHRSGICGEASMAWDDEDMISTASFNAVQTWTTDPDAIASATFVSFMLIIIVVWFMLMMAEFHQIMRWLIVLTHIETKASGEKLTVSNGGSGKQFGQLPLLHRNFVLVCIWLPRFMIFCLTTYVGTIFLGAATNYIDLLLNATALGFLIEIDTMLHHACTDDRTRQEVAGCGNLTVASKSRFLRLHQSCFSFVYSNVLVVASGLFVWFVNSSAEGNFMISKRLQCLCSVGGEECLGAALLAHAVKPRVP